MAGRTHRRLFSGTAAAIAAAVLLSAAAWAVAMSPGETSYEVAVKLKKGPPAFHGKVVSQNEFCAANRPVKMKKKVRGHKDPVLGTTNTDSAGNWKIKVTVKTGAYYAKAPAYGSASLGIQCVGAKSRVLAAD